MFIRPIRRTRFRTNYSTMDPVTAEIMLDPLNREEIERLAEMAEQPELADSVMVSLPDQQWRLSAEELFLKQAKAALKAQHSQETAIEAKHRPGQQILGRWMVRRAQSPSSLSF